MTQIDPPSFRWTSSIDFNGLDGSGGAPGTNVDEVLALVGASFAEAASRQKVVLIS